MAADGPLAPPGAVPVTVLGGYLGAGKTTLINQILASASEQRIVVVVNDFGAVNIDAELIRSRDGNTLELANGCVCCDLSGGMPAVMSQIAAMAPAPQRVLIEVSGVGDPGPVAAWGDHPGFRRGGVLVCADAEAVQGKTADRWVADTVAHQLRAADLLLLTKTDLISEQKATAVATWLREFAPGVPVARARDVDSATLLNLATASTTHDPAPHGPAHTEHVSLTLSTHGPVTRARVEALLNSLPESVVRTKGFLQFADDPNRRTVVHQVGANRTFEDTGPWKIGDISQIAFIAVPTRQHPDPLDDIPAAWTEFSIETHTN